jgi:catechol 2,3-dioxygenase-like lactoylglutathione lyase family enzyme
MTTSPPTGMHEMVLEVADLDAAERFYRDVIGLAVVDRWSGDRDAVWLATGDGFALGLWTRETGGDRAIHHGRGGAHVHFALRIPQGSVDDWQARLEATGEPVTRVDFDDGNRSVYIDDPDGNCVELMDAVVDWSGRPIPTRT